MGEGSVAVLGLGAMGAGMAHRLVEAGWPVIVHNRDPRKAEPLAAAGADVATSTGAAARRADAVLLALSDETAVESVLFDEAVAALRPNATVIDTSTVSPGYAASAAERLAARGARRVEACVVGNPAMARSGTLRVFTAGDETAAGDVRDLLGAIGKEVTHVGPAGSAMALKLAFNALLGAQVAALAEAVALGESGGLDRRTLLDTLTGSGFASPVLAFRGDFMRRREYEPAAFRARLMAKDLRLAIEAAASDARDLPVTRSALEAFDAAVACGRGDADAAVIAEVPAERSSQKGTPT